MYNSWLFIYRALNYFILVACALPYYKIMLSCYFLLIMASTISASVQVLPAGFSYIKDIEPGI